MSDKQMTELATQFTKATDDVKALGTELTGRMEKGEKNLDDLKAKADEALVTMNELKGRMTDLEQANARSGGDDEPQYKSHAEKLMDSDAFKSMQTDPAGKKASIQVKALVTSATTDADGSAGSLINPQRLSGILTPPNERLSVRDLIMPGTTESNSIEYDVETGFTNNAGAQAAEGDIKNQSEIKFAEATANVKTIAHWVEASRQVLDDAKQLQSHINGRLMYGLKLKEDRQLLNGDGLNGNLKGLIPQSTAFADPANITKYTIIDQLRLAMLQAVLAEYPASAHVLNPIDWARIELEKDDNGVHIIGVPQGNAPASLWRAPVVESKAMGVGKFLTGAFNMAAQIFDREDAMIAVSAEDRDNFIRNKVTILCEERLALAVYRPEALIYGDLQAKTA